MSSYTRKGEETMRLIDSRRLVSVLTLLMTISIVNFGCNFEPDPQKIQFAIKAIDTNNMPVNGVYIYLSAYEGVWGATNAEGLFNAESTAKVGDTLGFRLEAPEGYELIPSDDASFVVTESDQPILVEYTGQFKPPKREYLFMVEGIANDQVLINNQDITTLDSTKRVMLMHSGAPGEEFIIQVGFKGYRGVFSITKEVYLITPEVQKSLKDPQNFIGPLQEEIEPPTGDRSPNANEDIEEDYFEKAVAIVKPKVRRPSRSKSNTKPRRRKKVEPIAERTKSFDFDEPSPRRAEPPPRRAEPPPRRAEPPPRRAEPPPRRAEPPPRRAEPPPRRAEPPPRRAEPPPTKS